MKKTSTHRDPRGSYSATIIKQFPKPTPQILLSIHKVIHNAYLL